VQYKLRTKGSSETVDAVVTSGDREAKQYFQLKKRLPLEIFEKLYEVVKVEAVSNDRDRLTRV
jgi:hypothetical protein|tara:strand:- start:23 stop:211 length:189 start_codon:yes stop_codon:yes gene_type:complete